LVGRDDHRKRRHRAIVKFFQHPSRRRPVVEPPPEKRQARQLVHQAPPDEQRDDQHNRIWPRAPGTSPRSAIFPRTAVESTARSAHATAVTARVTKVRATSKRSG